MVRIKYQNVRSGEMVNKKVGFRLNERSVLKIHARAKNVLKNRTFEFSDDFYESVGFPKI